jgi:hypothetical protein
MNFVEALLTVGNLQSQLWINIVNLLFRACKSSLHNLFWSMLLYNTNFTLNQDLLFLCAVFHIDWCSSTSGLRLTLY